MISVITLDDDEEEDPISEMKLNLHETYLKYKESVDLTAVPSPTVDSPSYSPTQSPIYVAPESPLNSPKCKTELVDLTSPCSPTSSPPPLPPSPQPPEKAPLPPLPPPIPCVPSFPDPVPATSLSIYGEPLPPGVDDDPCSPPRYSSTTHAQDMEIDHETEEAETNFFLSQQNLFPASVWDFSKSSKPPETETREVEEGELSDEDVATERSGLKRKFHEDIESQASQEEEDALEEEEASLRSLLLAQVEKSKSQSKLSTPQPEDHQSESNKKKLPSSKSKKSPGKVKAKDNNNRKFKKVKLKEKKPESKQRINPVKISEADQRKYFPNLSKKVVVNISGNESDSEEEVEEQGKETTKQGSINAQDNFFGLDLEAFLKQARDSTQVSTHGTESKIGRNSQEKQKVVTKKIAITPQLKAHAQRLTLEDKKKLISAKITHLSHSKQIEYQRLKVILAKKQREKQLKAKTTLKETANKENTNVEPPKSIQKSSSINEEEEEKLRMKLIMGMKKKTPVTNSAKSKTPSPSQSPQKVLSTKNQMTVQIAGDSREVKLNSSFEQNNVESEKRVTSDTLDDGSGRKLKTAEDGVIKMRKGLSQSLFKLSAYMSQLQKETSGVESAVKYIETLKKQLEDTEKLVMSREKKVESLREVIRESHRQITVQKQEMSEKEEECKSLGVSLLGGEYKPPVDGAENIRKKLEMIRNTAMRVKTATTTYNSTEAGSEDTTGNNDDGPGLPGDYTSPLEHLSQGKGPVLDPGKEICRFDLSGKCLDDNCPNQHISK